MIERPLFRADIEGLRAIAILLVVAYHVELPGFSGGYLGVDIFFVLSGYLITQLLMQEAAASGRIGFAGFYARRARRLIPAMALTMLATILAATVIYAPEEQYRLSSSAVASALYSSNIHFARRSTDYLGGSAQFNPFLHTWSLGVEEQFYVGWPLLLMAGLFCSLALSRRKWLGVFNPHRACRCIASVGVVSFVLWLLLREVREPWAFFSPVTRVWEFALGALGSIRSFARRDSVHSLARPRAARFTTALKKWQAAAGLGLMLLTAPGFAPTRFAGVFLSLAATIGAALVVTAGPAERGLIVTKILGARIMQALGRLSYGWYLWHWPVLVLGAALTTQQSLLHRVGCVIVALALAEISYRFVENPIRRQQILAAPPVRSLAMAAIVLAGGTGLAFAWRTGSAWASYTPGQARFTQARADLPSLFSNKCFARVGEIEVNPCVFGAAGSSTTVVLFGDSHAVNWFPPLESAATQNGWRLVTVTKAGCPAVAVGPPGETSSRPAAECREWQNSAVEAIRAEHPDVIVMASHAHHPFSEEQWRSGTSGMLSALSPASTHMLLLKDIPRLQIIAPTCLARRSWRLSILPREQCEFSAADPAASTVFDIQRSVAEQHKNAATADLTRSICPDRVCPMERDGVILYSDTHHLTTSFSRTLTAVLEEELLRLFPVLSQTHPAAVP